MRSALVRLILAFSASGSLLCASAQYIPSSPTASRPPSERNARKLARLAHTTEQFSAVASCYDQLQSMYLRKADAEKQEIEWRIQHSFNLAVRYPSPLDSARNLYDYYTRKASQMRAEADLYRQKASAVVSTSSK